MKNKEAYSNNKTSIKVEDISISEDIIKKWQNIVNILAKIISVPVVLIMRINLPYIEVFRSSETNSNPYKVGDKEHLIGSGLYCETVIKTKEKLLIPNALKDKKWSKNPDVKLGLISYLGFPILYPNGNVFGTLCVLDLKENKYNKDIEELMIQLKEVIESHLSLIYYNIIINDSEEKYRKAYEQVNVYKDLFSHDINNIIQVINSSAELYIQRKSKLKELQVEDLIKRIENASKQAIRLIFNVRKLSELEESFEMSLKEEDVIKVINEAINNTRRSFQDREIDIKTNISNKTIKIQANEFLLDVFENILNNAVKYNENLLIKIDISISNVILNKNGYIKLEFIDNGIGIPDDRKEIIFQKGFKNFKGVKGMGIGLSLVKTLVERYNGKIWIEDRVKGDYSKGSKFILLIPETKA